MHHSSDAAPGRSESGEARKGGEGAEPADVASELPIEKAFWHIFACATLCGFHVSQGNRGSYRISLVKLAYGGLGYVLQLSFTVASVIRLCNAGNLCLDNYKSMILLMPIAVGIMFTMYARGLLLWNAKGMKKYMESIYREGLRAPPNKHFVAWLLLAVILALVDSSIVVCMLPVPNACRNKIIIPIVTNALFAFVFDLYMCVFIYTLRIAYEKLNCRIKQVAMWSVAEVQEVGKTWLRLSRLLDEHNQTFEYLMQGRFTIFLAEMMCLLYSLGALSHTKQKPLALVVPLIESLVLALTLSLVGEKMKQIQESIVGNLCEVMFNLHHTADPLPCRTKYKIKASACLADRLNISEWGLTSSIMISCETQVNIGSRQARKLRDGPNSADDREVRCEKEIKEKYDKNVERKGGEGSGPRHGSNSEVKDRGRDTEGGLTEVRNTETTTRWEKQKENLPPLPCQDVKVKREFKGCQEEMKQAQSMGGTPGNKQRRNGCGAQCGCCLYELNSIIARMEARPAVIKVWGQTSLGWESFVYLAGLVITYLVILLQLRPVQVP